MKNPIPEHKRDSVTERDRGRFSVTEQTRRQAKRDREPSLVTVPFHDRRCDKMFHGTTIVAIRREGKVAMAGDGQVTLGNSIAMKHGARKVRKIYNDQVVAGFAGSVADAFTLLDKFEGKMEEYRGNLKRASVELAKEWRMDKYMRQLEAMLIVANKEMILVLS